jgi:hypothetical protein
VAASPVDKEMNVPGEGAVCNKCGGRYPRYACKACGSIWCHSCHKKHGKVKWGYGVCGNCKKTAVGKRF